jgi:hypothetical protein
MDSCNIYECHYEENQKFLEKADELINLILNIPIPEIDMDSYNIGMSISAEQYALKKVEEFKIQNLKSSQGLASSNSRSNPDKNKSPSTDDFSDGVPKSES